MPKWRISSNLPTQLIRNRSSFTFKCRFKPYSIDVKKRANKQKFTTPDYSNILQNLKDLKLDDVSHYDDENANNSVLSEKPSEPLPCDILQWLTDKEIFNLLSLREYLLTDELRPFPFIEEMENFILLSNSQHVIIEN
jgi:hypothetical protein